MHPDLFCAGVAVYPNYRTGLDETARTLQEPRYASVLADLKNSAPPSSTTAAVATSPWGTWQGVSPRPNVERLLRLPRQVRRQ